MKRRNILKAAAAGLAAAPLAISSTNAQAASKVRLRMQTYWGTESDEIHDQFLDDVKVASNKSIRIKRFRGARCRAASATPYPAGGPASVAPCRQRGYLNLHPRSVPDDS